jgi:hypothetical protein
MCLCARARVYVEGGGEFRVLISKDGGRNILTETYDSWTDRNLKVVLHFLFYSTIPIFMTRGGSYEAFLTGTESSTEKWKHPKRLALLDRQNVSIYKLVFTYDVSNSYQYIYVIAHIICNRSACTPAHTERWW